MMSPANKVVSILLVALQFALIGALLWSSDAWQFSWLAVLLTIAGVALGLAALVTNRPGNFNIRLAPKPTGRWNGWIRPGADIKAT
jgi:hypothetical protein